MKNRLIYIVLPIICVIVFLISSNSSLYSINKFSKNSKIIIYSNKEKVINIRNKHNKSYIYNFYIISNNYNNSSIYINNKKIDNDTIKKNSNIIFKTIFNKKENKVFSIKIHSNKLKKYIIYVNKVRYNESLINYLKSRASKNIYFLDIDSAKELYKFGKEYKYVGMVPNNYLYYNCKSNNQVDCQLWRIIGTEIKQNKEDLKIIKNDSEKYYNMNYNIYKKSKNKFYVLNKNDYINSFRKVNNKCVKNIYECNQKSFLTPKNDEIIDDNGKFNTLSNEGNIIRKQSNYLYRPVQYLSGYEIINGGDGSLNRPYFLK